MLNLIDNVEIVETRLNPVLLAIQNKSSASLKALLSTFNIRSSSFEGDWRVPLSEAESAHFSNLALPLLLLNKDLESLQLVLRQEQFLIRGHDIHSFVILAKRENWLQGVKAFLQSSTVAFFFTAQPFQK